MAPGQQREISYVVIFALADATGVLFSRSTVTLLGSNAMLSFKSIVEDTIVDVSVIECFGLCL